LSAVRDCLFNVFAATLHNWRPFLHPQPEDAPCRGDRDPLNTVGHCVRRPKCFGSRHSDLVSYRRLWADAGQQGSCSEEQARDNLCCGPLLCRLHENERKVDVQEREREKDGGLLRDTQSGHR
jgi:hypothetical protein